MQIEELEDIYGKFYDDDLRKWAIEKLKSIDGEKEEIFLTVLNEIHSKKKGIPDKTQLSRAYEKVVGRKPKVYVWAVCQNCKCEYDIELPYCPECYKNGLICRAKDGRKSDFPPPAKVIRYNKTYINGDKGEMNCYDCQNKENSFCIHFGDNRWNCGKEEFEYCNCKSCCIRIKKMNENIEKGRAKSTDNYPIAFPIRKGGAD